METILVTGSVGFICANLALRLLEKGLNTKFNVAQGEKRCQTEPSLMAPSQQTGSTD